MKVTAKTTQEVQCYECEKLTTRLVWRSRCLTCVIKRIEWLEDFECKKQERIDELEQGILKTLEDNLDLTDGDNCTLYELKKLVGWD